jgi:stearoyl-CoA desaturase (delta-9 desaturase)
MPIELTSPWLAPLWALAVTQVAVLATSIYFHRAIAHGALRVHPVADVVFRTILWMTTGQRRQQWVAVHRKHHTFTDKEGDPHSPRMLGFWKVQIFNVYYYAREANNAETLRKFAPDVAEDWLDRRVFGYGYLGAAAGIGLGVAVLGPLTGVLVALLHLVFYVFVLAPLINGLGHWRGKQNFDSNTAYNWRFLSWLTAGEALHNNHHAHPKAPRFSVRRWEFDPSWPLIKAMAAVRLIVVVGASVRLS